MKICTLYRKFVLIAFVCTLYALSASTANAIFIGGGGTIGNADIVSVEVNPLGVQLASPALILESGGSPAVGWNEDYNDTFLAIFTGPLFADLIADVILDGSLGDAEAWRVTAYNGDTLATSFGGAAGGLLASDIPLMRTRAELETILASVPEPSILALLSIGLAGIGFARKRKTA